MAEKINNIAIVGTGLMGAGWAAFYAGKGFGVKLYDVDTSACRNGYQSALGHLAFLRDHDVISQDGYDHAVTGMSISEDLTDALHEVQLVQESVIEQYDIKKDIFKQIDRLTCPDVILASSSSGLLISELQKVMSHPQRSLITHPFNPPHLIPLVELVPGRQTAQDKPASGRRVA